MTMCHGKDANGQLGYTTTRRDRSETLTPKRGTGALRVRWDDDRKLYCHAGSSEPIGWIDRVEALAKEWGVEIEVLS